MNWRRGFLRLYAVVAAAWVGFAGWIEWGVVAEVLYLDAACWREHTGGLRLACGPALLQEETWAAAFRRMLLPPVLLFLLGLAGAWVARGFRRTA